MTPSSTTSQFLRTMSLVALAIMGMFAVDTFLANMEASESHAEAARLYAEGQRLLSQDHNTEAVSRFEDALAIDRSNRDFQLALARAQLAAGQLPQAETTLDTLLLADSTSGTANLTMARLLVKQGKIPEAISYYHRAIYGTWASDRAANQLKTRFELIDYLAQQNRKEELLGELLAVEDQAPEDVPTQLKIGKMFLEAGSAARAADVFQQLVKEERSSRTQPAELAQAYSGLGEADFARGDYRAAVNEFSTALRLNPEDQAASQRLDLCNRVLMLDPARRGLDQAERLRRSHEVLDMTIQSVAACSPSADLDDARKTLAQRVAPAKSDAAAEADLDLAEKLWQARTPACAAVPNQPADQALALVLKKAAQ